MHLTTLQGAILSHGYPQAADTCGQLSKQSKSVVCNTNLSQFRLEW